jgi:hypothetical protein
MFLSSVSLELHSENKKVLYPEMEVADLFKMLEASNQTVWCYL